jgi:hypothetical protein
MKGIPPHYRVIEPRRIHGFAEMPVRPRTEDELSADGGVFTQDAPQVSLIETILLPMKKR